MGAPRCWLWDTRNPSNTSRPIWVRNVIQGVSLESDSILRISDVFMAERSDIFFVLHGCQSDGEFWQHVAQLKIHATLDKWSEYITHSALHSCSKLLANYTGKEFGPLTNTSNQSTVSTISIMCCLYKCNPDGKKI